MYTLIHTAICFRESATTSEIVNLQSTQNVNTRGCGFVGVKRDVKFNVRGLTYLVQKAAELANRLFGELQRMFVEK